MVAGWLPPPCPTGRGGCGDGEELFLGILQCGCERGELGGELGGRQGRKGGGEGKKGLVLCLQSVFSWVFTFSLPPLPQYFLTTFLILTSLTWCSFPSFLRLEKAFAECGKK